VKIPLPVVIVLVGLFILLAVFRALSTKPRTTPRKFKPRWRDDDRPSFR
jgi:hypothetical protein